MLRETLEIAQIVPDFRAPISGYSPASIPGAEAGAPESWRVGELARRRVGAPESWRPPEGKEREAGAGWRAGNWRA